MSAAVAHHPTTSLMTTMQQKNKTIGVMGSGKEPWLAFSEPLGAWLAQAGFNLLTGGGQGVMLAVARAFAGVPGRAGRSIGILPTRADPLAGFVPLDGYPHPFVDVPIALGETLAGTWNATGVPAFDPATGRFLGYRGLARRTDGAPPQPAPGTAPDLDALREMVHEIKTPLNAIIGFAEIIDGQFLGPADHRYRERAAEIVGQARLLLTAIDDLDFAAKTHSASAGAQPRANLGQLIERLAPSLRDLAAARGVELDCSRATGPMPALVEPELADRLIFRLANALIERAGEGEHLRLSVDSARGASSQVRTRPALLERMTPLRSSTERCFMNEGSAIANGAASVDTDSGPRPSAPTIAPRSSTAARCRMSKRRMRPSAR